MHDSEHLTIFQVSAQGADQLGSDLDKTNESPQGRRLEKEWSALSQCRALKRSSEVSTLTVKCSDLQHLTDQFTVHCETCFHLTLVTLHSLFLMYFITLRVWEKSQWQVPDKEAYWCHGDISWVWQVWDWTQDLSIPEILRYGCVLTFFQALTRYNNNKNKIHLWTLLPPTNPAGTAVPRSLLISSESAWPMEYAYQNKHCALHRSKVTGKAAACTQTNRPKTI